MNNPLRTINVYLDSQPDRRFVDLVGLSAITAFSLGVFVAAFLF